MVDKSDKIRNRFSFRVSVIATNSSIYSLKAVRVSHLVES
jgi:hypothetical protein